MTPARRRAALLTAPLALGIVAVLATWPAPLGRFYALALHIGPASQRKRLIEAAAALGPDGVPALVIALDGASPVERRRAARALHRLGPEAAPASAALIQALDDPAARSLALRALIRIGAAAVPRLIPSLNSQDGARRRSALYILNEIGPEAAQAIPAIKALRERADERERSFADQALRSLRRD